MGLFDSLFGSGDTDEISQAAALQRQQLEQGRQQASGNLTESRDQAIGFLQPTIDQGGAANRLLGDFVGVNGQGVQQEAFGGFQNDPGFAALQDAGIEAIDRSASARGLRRSGGTQKELFSFGQRLQNQFFNDRLNRLAALGAQGVGASGSAAGITQQTGGQLADLNFGAAQLNANSQVNQSNAIQQQRQVPINNLLSALTAGAQVGGKFA